MAESAGLAWYDTGTITLTQGSTAVTGSNTTWSSAGIKAGDILTVDDAKLYQIAAVNSNTSITLKKAYGESSGTGLNYAIIRNFAATVTSQLAARVAELVNKYERYIDADLTKITGPAADFSEQYKGTWASGRTYKALDVVIYGKVFYMTHTAHTSGSGNKPDASGSLWVNVSVEIPSDIITEVTTLNDKIKPPYILTHTANVSLGKNNFIRGKLHPELKEGETLASRWNAGINSDDPDTAIMLGDVIPQTVTFTPPPEATTPPTGNTTYGSVTEDSLNYANNRPQIIVNEDGTYNEIIFWQFVDMSYPISQVSLNSFLPLSLRAVMPIFPLWYAPMTSLTERPDTGWTTGGYYASPYYQSGWKTLSEIVIPTFPLGSNVRGVNSPVSMGSFVEGQGFNSFATNRKNLSNMSEDIHPGPEDESHKNIETSVVSSGLHITNNIVPRHCDMHWEMIPTCQQLFGHHATHLTGIWPGGTPATQQFALFRLGGSLYRHKSMNWATSGWIAEHFWLQDGTSADEFAAVLLHHYWFVSQGYVRANVSLGIRPVIFF